MIPDPMGYEVNGDAQITCGKNGETHCSIKPFNAHKATTRRVPLNFAHPDACEVTVEGRYRRSTAPAVGKLKSCCATGRSDSSKRLRSDAKS